MQQQADKHGCLQTELCTDKFRMCVANNRSPRKVLNELYEMLHIIQSGGHFYHALAAERSLLSGTRYRYRWHKKLGHESARLQQVFAHNLCQMPNDFQNSFTARLGSRSATESSPKMPSHLKQVTTLPREI